MANHAVPTTTNNKTDILSLIDARLDDALLQLDPAHTTATNIPTNSIRWSSAASKWQKWNGSAWSDLSATYAIVASNVSGTVAIANGGTGATSQGAARLALGLGDMAQQTSANVGISGGEITDLTSFNMNDGPLTVARVSNTVAAFNRKTTDGNVIIIQQGGTTEGVISVSGVTVTYGTFTGMHWSQPEGLAFTEILRGTIVETVDALCEWPGEANHHLPKFRVCQTAGSAAVYGVFDRWDEDGDAEIVSLGVFLIRIAAGQTVSRGDLIEAGADGCGVVQADGVLRSSTVAKITSNVVAETYSDGSFLVPCSMLCG